MESLRKKLLVGGFWNSFSQFGVQGVNFVITIVLARLLTPTDFGLVGMVNVFIAFLGFFSELGLITTLVSKEKVDELDLNTAFWCGIVFSGVLYALVYRAAPLISLFYDNPRLVAISRVLFAVFPVRAVGFIITALEYRALRYNRLAAAHLSSTIAAGACGIWMAFAGYGVWSLVALFVVKEIVQIALLLVVTQWKPRLRFSFARTTGIIPFGFQITLNNLMKFASQNADYLLVGKLLGPHALGIYTLAFRLSRYALQKLVTIVGRMLFPAFSRIRGDITRTRHNVLKVSLLGLIVLLPFEIMLLVSGRLIVEVLVGPEWKEAVPILRIFLIYIVFSSFSFGDDPLMIAFGKVRSLNITKFVATVLLAAGGYIGIRLWGLYGMALAFSIVTGGYVMLIKAQVLRLIDIAVYRYIHLLTKYLVSGGVLYCILVVFHSLLVGRVDGLLLLLLEGLVCAGALGFYGMVSGLVDVKMRALQPGNGCAQALSTFFDWRNGERT